jgi:hypothetical protein
VGIPGKGFEFGKKICSIYLVRIFDEASLKAHGNNSGCDFKSNGKTYSIRASCLTKDGRSWSCAFGRSTADSFLFFGFRDLTKLNLEFCLDIPADKFRNLNRITINDDGGYHLKGYNEFSIDLEKLQKMQDVMAAIESKDIEKIKEHFPKLYDGYHSLY